LFFVHTRALDLCTLYIMYFTDRLCARETREGWPLLTVETDVNGDSKSTNERGSRGSSLVGSLSSSVRDFYPASQYKIFFSSPYTISIYVPPSPSNLGRQPCRAACL
jgi:hypothetical protein